MGYRKFHKMLKKPNKGQDETRDPLALLYRKILSDLGITAIRWGQLLHLYCSKKADVIGKDKISDYKGNLTKAVTSDKLSFQKFTQCIALHDADEALITVTLKKIQEDGTVVETNHTLDLTHDLDDDHGL